MSIALLVRDDSETDATLFGNSRPGGNVYGSSISDIGKLGFPPAPASNALSITLIDGTTETGGIQLSGKKRKDVDDEDDKDNDCE